MSISRTIGEDVVFAPIESKEIPGFYEIPSFPEYLVDPAGAVWYKRAGRIVQPREHATSTGSYLAISARLDDKFTHVLIHLLVAEAFHGPSDGVRDQVNHIDGDKHNNHYTNLEWVTRSENLIHAYKTGLRSDRRSVLVVDHLKDTAYELYSMREVGRHFNLAKGAIWRTIRDHREVKYMDRYTFMLPQTVPHAVRRRDSKEKGGVVKDIAVKNYLTGQVFVVSDQGSAELLTGVKRGTINFNLILATTPYRLIKGWCFKYFDDPADWPIYSEETIRASLIRNASGRPITVTDTRTNTTSTFASIHAFAELLGEYPNAIRRSLKKTPGRFKQFDIQQVK